MQDARIPPIVSITGTKNSGKTTLTVALAAEMKRRGYRIATLKHGHHRFEIDQPGTDSWRHVHEGEAEAVLIVSSQKLAMVMHTDGEPDPRALVERHFGGRGYDLVLVEGYKHGPFPKVEVSRSSARGGPVHDPQDPDAASLYLAIVTDDPTLDAACPVIPLDLEDPAGRHVGRVADLIEAQFLREGS